ncbi:hypothetical protein WJX74_002724 [Apatococcus lobatus]|uniref:Uncharacterized protein n=1 Tax=Apatococcus lobatus TaxID=904363 RepID=A0AAW1R0U2_9CHLO
MSTSAPTPLPATTPSATAEAAAATDATGDAYALAADSAPAPAPTKPSAAAQRLGRHAGALLAKPVNAAVLLALVTYATVHFLQSKYPPSRLKLVAAAAFGALVYGAAALQDKDPVVALKGLRIIANDATATSNLSITRRLLAAWYITFPAVALGAACVKRLSPVTMVGVAGGLMVLPAVLKSQGITV